MTMNTRNNEGNVGGVVFYAVFVVTKESRQVIIIRTSCYIVLFTFKSTINPHYNGLLRGTRCPLSSMSATTNCRGIYGSTPYYAYTQ
jgi:hypothetical protein